RDRRMRPGRSPETTIGEGEVFRCGSSAAGVHFAFLFAPSKREQYLARYVLGEYSRGRSLDDAFEGRLCPQSLDAGRASKAARASGDRRSDRSADGARPEADARGRARHQLRRFSAAIVARAAAPVAVVPSGAAN